MGLADMRTAQESTRIVRPMPAATTSATGVLPGAQQDAHGDAPRTCRQVSMRLLDGRAEAHDGQRADHAHGQERRWCRWHMTTGAVVTRVSMISAVAKLRAVAARRGR